MIVKVLSNPSHSITLWKLLIIVHSNARKVPDLKTHTYCTANFCAASYKGLNVICASNTLFTCSFILSGHTHMLKHVYYFAVCRYLSMRCCRSSFWNLFIPQMQNKSAHVNTLDMRTTSCLVLLLSSISWIYFICDNTICSNQEAYNTNEY